MLIVAVTRLWLMLVRISYNRQFYNISVSQLITPPLERRVVDKNKTVRLLSYAKLVCVAGNTSNKLTDLRQHYLSVLARPRQKQLLQVLILVVFKA